MRTLTFIYRWPGLIEAIAEEPEDFREEIESEGYRDSGIPDLLIDLDPESGQPHAFMSVNFDKNYPAVIWGIRNQMNDELFDVPQAGREGVPLHMAFSWAYFHFILQDGSLLASTEPFIQIDPNNVAQVVLAHALQTIAV
jgi:hypothetical protein